MLSGHEQCLAGRLLETGQKWYKFVTNMVLILNHSRSNKGKAKTNKRVCISTNFQFIIRKSHKRITLLLIFTSKNKNEGYIFTIISINIRKDTEISKK